MSKILPFKPRDYPQSEGSSALCPQVILEESPVIPDSTPETKTRLYVNDDGGGERLAPSYPQRCEQTSAELRRDLERDMGTFGVCYKARFFRLFDLEDIALALEDVKDVMRAVGAKKISNPGGLFVRVLEDRTGRKAFR